MVAYPRSRFELALELAPAAVLAAAVAFAGTLLRQPVAAALAPVVFLLAFAALRAMPTQARFVLPDFAASAEPEELVLTEDDVLKPEHLAGSLQAVADDILSETSPAPEPSSRVIALFGAAGPAAPRELSDRVERHLRARTNPQPDASQALSDALAELRRSLR